MHKNAWTAPESVCVEKSWENKLEAYSNCFMNIYA